MSWEFTEAESIVIAACVIGTLVFMLGFLVWCAWSSKKWSKLQKQTSRKYRFDQAMCREARCQLCGNDPRNKTSRHCRGVRYVCS